MTTTPEQRREAWVCLTVDLQRSLVSTREHARTAMRMSQAILDDCGLSPGHTPEDWEATAWAAQKLLESVMGLEPPAIPEDPALGQLTIQDALSTPGENVEWCHPDGSFMPDGARTKKATKTRGEQANPGSWWAIVSWDARDAHPEVKARCLLANLVPIHPPE